MRRSMPLLLLLAATLPAQDRPPPEEELRTKLASPFLKKAAWITDYDAALASAKKRRKLIFGYFTTAGY